MLFIQNYVLIIAIAIGIAGVIGIYYGILYEIRKRPKVSRGRAIILRKLNDTYFIAYKKKIDLSKKDFTVKDKTYLINTEKMLYLDKMPTYLYLEGNTQPITWEIKNDKSADEVNLYVKQNVISQLVKSLTAQSNINIMFVIGILLGLAMGIMAGILLSGYLPIHVIPVSHAVKNTTTIIVPKLIGVLSR